MKKRMLAIALTIAMLLSLVPAQVFAAQTSTGHTEHNFVELQPESLAPTEQTEQSVESQVTPQTEVPYILSLMNYDAAEEDVRHLSETIGPRPTGSASELLALDYVAKEFQDLGYAVERQDFDLGARPVGDIFLGELTLAAAIPNNGVIGEAEGIAVYLDDPANVASLGTDLSGKIVFFPGNWRSGKQPETYAAIAALNNANAEAVVVMMDLSVSSDEVSKWPLPDMDINDCGQTIDIPVLLTAAMEAERVPAYIEERGDVEVRVKSSATSKSQNVIGVKQAAVETDLTIYVTAHIDTVNSAPGANDNGSGVAGLLSLARAFENVETNYNIRFVVFGAEEILLVGSRYFVGKLSEEEIGNAIGNYNLDMIASGYCNYLCLDTRTDANDTHVTRMSWDAAMELGFTAENCYVDYGGCSDHIAFHDAGIPALGFIWETDRATHNLEPYYHTAQDNMEINFSKEKLTQALGVVALAVYNDATADYAAVVGEGVYKEYYATMKEAEAAAAETGATVRSLNAPSDDKSNNAGPHLHCLFYDDCPDETCTHSREYTAMNEAFWDELERINWDGGKLAVAVPEGNYYLSKNITIPEDIDTILVEADFAICLNGKTLDLNKSRFVIRNNVTLHISDHHDSSIPYDINTPSGGIITVGKNNRATIYAEAGGTLHFYDGTMTNPDDYSGNVNCNVSSEGMVCLWDGVLLADKAGLFVQGGTTCIKDGYAGGAYGVYSKTKTAASPAMLFVNGNLTQWDQNVRLANDQVESYISFDEDFLLSGEGDYRVLLATPLNFGESRRITDGWGELGEAFPDRVPFVSVQGYKVVERDYTREDGTTTREVYFVYAHEHCSVYVANCPDIAAGKECSHEGEKVSFATALYTEADLKAALGITGSSGAKLRAGSYVLMDDIILDYGSDIATAPDGENVDIYLCLNGHTLSFGHKLQLNNGLTMHICDCDGSGNGQGRIEANGYNIISVEGATLNLYSGTVLVETSTSSSDYPIAITNGATFNMYGGTVHSKVNNAVYVSNKSEIKCYVNIFGGEIKTEGNGYGIAALAECDVHISAPAKIHHTGSSKIYAAVSINHDDAKVTIDGGEIYGKNSAGIRVRKGTLILMDDPEINCGSDMGDIYLYTGKTITVGGKLTGKDTYSVKVQSPPEDDTTTVQITTDWPVNECNESRNNSFIFTSANADYGVKLVGGTFDGNSNITGGELHLYKLHKHCSVYVANCPDIAAGKKCTHEKAVYDIPLNQENVPESGDLMLESGDYFLTSDLVLRENQRLDINGEDVKICLNGHKITFSGTGHLTSDKEDEGTHTLHICDCSQEKTGEIVGEWKNVVAVYENCTTTLLGITLHYQPTFASEGGAAVYNEKGTLLVDECNLISDQHTTNGLPSYGIQNSSGTVTIQDSVISSYDNALMNSVGHVTIEGTSTLTTANPNTNVIYNENGTLIMNGGTVTGTGTTNSAVWIKGGSANIAGGSINGATNGIYTNETAALTVTGGTITGNNGYGIKHEGSTLTMEGAPEITGTKADIYLATDKMITVVGALEPVDGEIYTVDVAVPDGDMVRITDGFGANGNTENPFEYYLNPGNADKSKPQCFILGEGENAEVYIGYVHAHCVYGENCAYKKNNEECQHEQITFNIPMGDSFKTDSGFYFLTEELSIGYLNLPENREIHLCLNGRNLTAGEIDVNPLGNEDVIKLYIYDCDGKGSDNTFSIDRFYMGGNTEVHLISGHVVSAENRESPVSTDSAFFLEGGTFTVNPGEGSAGLYPSISSYAFDKERGRVILASGEIVNVGAGSAVAHLGIGELIMDGTVKMSRLDGNKTIADIALENPFGAGHAEITIGQNFAPEGEVYSVYVTAAFEDDGTYRITTGWGALGEKMPDYIPFKSTQGYEVVEKDYTRPDGTVTKELYLVKHQHCVYGENCADIKAGNPCSHDIIWFDQALDQAKLNALHAANPDGSYVHIPGGRYFLTEDVSTAELNTAIGLAFTDGGEVYICLNGHSLEAHGNTYDGILVLNQTKVYICECDINAEDGSLLTNLLDLGKYGVPNNGGEIYLHGGNTICRGAHGAYAYPDSTFVLDGGSLIFDPAPSDTALFLQYPSRTSHNNTYKNSNPSYIKLKSGSIVVIGEVPAVGNYGFGYLELAGDVQINAGEGRGDFYLDKVRTLPYDALITITGKLSGNEVYSVEIGSNSVNLLNTNGKYRITDGWSNAELSTIPFKSTQGYEVVELDYTRPDGTVTKELYLVKHQHCVYGANCEDVKAGNACSHDIIWFDQALDQEMMESFPRSVNNSDSYVHIPSGHYFLNSDIDMSFILGKGGLRFHEGATVYLCLNGHSITNLGEISVTGNAKVYICDCKNDPKTGENQGRIDVAHNVWAGLDNNYVDTGFLSFHGGTINVLEGSYNPLNVWHCGEFVLDGGTYVVNGNGAAGEAIYGFWYGASYPKLTLKSGTIKHTGTNYTVAQYGDTYLTLSGTVKIENDNAPADFYLNPEVYEKMTVLTITETFEPQGEIYSVELEGGLSAKRTKFRITDGWYKAELDMIPFVSTQGYMVVEMNYNGQPELYLVKPQADAYLWNGHDVAATGTQLFGAMYSYKPEYLTEIGDWTFAVSDVELVTQTLPVAVDGDRITFDAGVGGGYGGDAWITIQQVDEESGAILKTERLRVTLNIHIYDIKDSVLILDYALPVDMGESLFARDTMPGLDTDSAVMFEAFGKNAKLADDGLSLTYETLAEGELNYGTFTISEDGKAIYTPNAMLEGKDEVTLIFRAYKNGTTPSAIGTANPFKEVEMFKTVTVLPANVVYYEDSSAALKWNTDSTVITVTPQGNASVDYQDGLQSDEYGNDSNYTYAPDSYTGSGGTHKEITVKGEGTILSFTFTGMGFDVLGTTNAVSGKMEVYITGANGSTEYFPVVTRYTNGEITEAPLLHRELPYGTYTVEIKAIPEYDYEAPESEWTDHPIYGAFGVKVPPMKEYKLWLDGVRIYNPLDMEDANREHYNQAEREAVFVQIRDLILEGKAASVSMNADGTFNIGSGSVYYMEQAQRGASYEGISSPNGMDYLLAGPNNELYFNSATQAAVLYVKAENASKPMMLQVGIRKLNDGAFGTSGNPGIMSVEDNQEVVLVDSAKSIGYTEQYYTVELSNCATETIGGELYYRVVIASTEAAAFSISNLKYSNLVFAEIPGAENVLTYDENGELVQGETDEMPNLYRLAKQLRRAYNMLPEDASDADMKFKSVALTLANSIGMNIFVSESVLEGYENPYVLIEKLYADGIVYETCKVYPTETINGRINFYYDDISAKEMSATVRMTLFATRDGVLTRGATRDYGVLTYAMNTLGKTTDPALRTLLVDMLNYGAQAQVYFNFHEEFLANSTLTAEQKAWATAQEPTLVNGTMKDNPAIPGSGSYPFSITSASLVLEDKVDLTFYMNLNGDLAGKKLVVSYVDGAGKEIREEISAETFALNASGKYEATYDGLAAMDMRVLVTCWIADENGERLSNAATYGIECYAASKVKNEALKPLLLDMMRYGDSARNYFSAGAQG